MHEKRPGDGKTHLVTNAACFGCTIACGRISQIDKNHFTVVNSPKYWGASGGLEYENGLGAGRRQRRGRPRRAAIRQPDLQRADGMDPISFGATIGAVMELYQMGVLKKEQIGIESPFGSAAGAGRDGEMTAEGRGFGKEIGLGSASACAPSTAIPSCR
jgi:aldehyde:ferredoxin oxidoreductase